MPEELMLHEAIEAIRRGQRERGRDLLIRLLRRNQQNPEYWLWMSAAVDTLKERIYCLKTVLQLDPQNAAAKRGLAILGQRIDQDDDQPVRLVKRNWKVKLEREVSPPFRFHWTKFTSRLTGLSLLGVLIISLMALGIFEPKKAAIPRYIPPTKTPGPPPTYTATPTYIGYVSPPERTSTLDANQPVPLWKLLVATYTPTSVYVSTPHPINEAFRAGQMELADGQIENALNYFSQAAQIEPESADILYYIGEVYRQQGNDYAAIQWYGRAIVLNPYFAPGYLGRVRARLEIDPEWDVTNDLDQAILNDPYYGEAYLARAAHRISHNELEAAEADLQSAENLLATSPWLYLYQAQLALRTGESEKAYQAASRALELDRTSLLIYRVFGEAALSNGKQVQAIEALETYLKYEQEDGDVWLLLGKAYACLGSQEQLIAGLIFPVNRGDYAKAQQAFDKALQFDAQFPEMELYLAIFDMAAGEGQSAVNRLFEARKLEAIKVANSTKVDPYWFAINVAFGRALLLANRSQEAYAQLVYANTLAKSDDQKAAIYYWRAQANEGRGNRLASMQDWQALLNLPANTLPTGWVFDAQRRLATLSAPTLTLTPTPSPSLTPSRTPTITRTPTPTRTLRSSLTPTSTKTPTPIPNQ